MKDLIGVEWYVVAGVALHALLLGLLAREIVRARRLRR